MDVVEKINKVLKEENIPNLDSLVNKFLVGAQKIVDDYNEKNFPGQGNKLEIKKGSKYYKIISITLHDGKATSTTGSTWAFIDINNGDILKPASYNTPAKGARGNLNDDFGGLKRIGPYGPEYNRGE